MPTTPADGQPVRPLLAIDSSTEQAGVALYDGARVAELSWAAGRTQTATLLGQIDHLLGLHGYAVGDLGAIAVATGPGTFTGLRVGISLAKGLVLGLGPGVPLLGVPTLAAATLPFALARRPVVAVVAAGRGRLVWAEYGPAAAGQALHVPPRNGTAEELAAAVLKTDGAIVTGELTPEQETIVAAVAGATIVPTPLRGRRPAALAALAWTRLLAGEADDPATLEPVYLGR